MKNSRMDGYGRYIYANGDVYYGYFVNHRKHGEGRIVKANGKVVEGFWQKDKMLKEDGTVSDTTSVLDSQLNYGRKTTAGEEQKSAGFG